MITFKRTISWIISSLTLSILMTQTNSDTRKATKMHKKYHWGFYEEHNIIILERRNFDRAVRELPHLFILFYIKSCPLTKKFRPNFLKIAKLMKDEVHPIAIAQFEVDGENLEYAQRYGVEESPGFRYFRQKKPIKYEGEMLEVDHIMRFLFRARWPETQLLRSQPEINTFIKKGKVNAIYYGEDKQEPEFIEFIHSYAHFPRIRFAHVFKYSLLGPYKARAPCVVIHTIFADNKREFCKLENPDFSEKSLMDFIEDFNFIENSMFNKSHSFALWNHKRTYITLFINGENSDKELEYEHKLLKASKKMGKGAEVIVASQKKENAFRLRERLMLDKHHIPGVYCLAGEKTHLHKYRFEKKLTVENLIKFKQECIRGNLPRYYHSQLEEELMIFEGNFKAVSTNQLQKIFKQPGKHLVIYLFKPHSPFFQNTKKLLEIISKKEILLEEHIEFYAIDIIKNEFPEFFEGSYKHYPAHDLHERIIFLKTMKKNKRKPLIVHKEIEPRNIENGGELLKAVTDLIPNYHHHHYQVSKQVNMDKYLSDIDL